MSGWKNRSQLKQIVSKTRKSNYLSSSAAASDLERNQSAMTLRPPPPTRTWMEAVWGISYLHGEDVDSQSNFLRSKLRRIDKSPLSLFPISKQVYRRTRLVEEEDGASNPNFPALGVRTDM